MPEDSLDELLKAFALESRLAARAEMLAMAAQADVAEALARTLRAQTASRQVRARRLLRLARGKISRGREAVLQTARGDQEQASELYDGLSLNAAVGLEHSAKVERLMPGMLLRAAKAENSPKQEGYAVLPGMRICETRRRAGKMPGLRGAEEQVRVCGLGLGVGASCSNERPSPRLMAAPANPQYKKLPRSNLKPKKKLQQKGGRFFHRTAPF